MRAGYIFCDTHRHGDKHACDFDYRNHGKGIVQKALPKPTRQAGKDFTRLDSAND